MIQPEGDREYSLKKAKDINKHITAKKNLYSVEFKFEILRAWDLVYVYY